MRAIQIAEFGGPEVLELVELPEPAPGAGQTRIAVRFAGVNYADTHQTDDSYLVPQSLPFVPGTEVVGTDPAGRRVAAFVDGGYAQQAVADDALVFAVPDEVDDASAAALLLQGVTAWHLLRTSARLAVGESVVVHAGAGGVGSLAVQLAQRFGAGRVIATASSAEKRALAVDLGADEAVDSRTADMKAALQQANGGAKVDVVLEMVGGAVFDGSLAALAPFGRLVTYGTAGRQPPSPIHPMRLVRRSQAIVGYWLAHNLQRPDTVAEAMAELFALTAEGALRPVVGGVYPLAQAAAAHTDLRERRTTGKLLLDATA